ncbi:MAG: DNA repair protein RecN [Prevotella sp.]|uniref:DNA repair protein RecN n=1 Tax=Prevotella sp. P5-92 TaxID=2024222 RepID=UPI000B95FC8A|nr:DNA repair protein RecN [Prevotella sp. P5-92]MDD6820386.1 DNA repair protein RecN [Prevotella sp.]OYP57033.1 DNA repair protein RecN [Prevotella sp. P5-92]
MLKQLYIRNFTLIERLDMTFREGFSVITGETGAGKSIILGAIGLLKGQRADSKLIKRGADKCVIEAHFDLSRYGMEAFFIDNDVEYDPDDCIVRREITASGKSRAFVNDTPVPLSVLKELGEQLIDVHSQHQNLLLGTQDFQMEVVDIIADDRHLINDYRAAFDKYRLKQYQLDEMRRQIENNKANADFLQYQYDELSAASLVEDEQKELEALSNQMSHYEDIKTALYQADNALSGEGNGVTENLRTAINALHSIESVMPKAGELASRMDADYIDLKDIADEVEAQLDNVDFDPKRLDNINDRLDKIYSLEKKYHLDTVEQLIHMRDTLRKQLENIENGDGDLRILEGEVEKTHKEAEAKAATLSEARHKAARKIEKEISQRLVSLGMPNIQFVICLTSTDLTPSGADKVAYMFSANKNVPLQPAAQVASGGEIARLMLSLKAMISGAVKLPTIIFDEIDTGVSGKIAERMAEIMCEMGNNERQVISITHLPQIAAMGATHYKVFKEDKDDVTVSTMTMLSAEDRVREIAQMLSGSDISEAAINNAKALLKYK